LHICYYANKRAAKDGDARQGLVCLVCAVVSETRANGGTSETWGMVYLIYLVVRIGSPTRRTRETNMVFS
jgi:hypothetical protein